MRIIFSGDFDNEEMQRSNLLKPVDSHNVTRACGSTTAIENSNDGSSIGVWVEENEKDFFCYSPLGESDETFMLRKSCVCVRILLIVLCFIKFIL